MPSGRTDHQPTDMGAGALKGKKDGEGRGMKGKGMYKGKGKVYKGKGMFKGKDRGKSNGYKGKEQDKDVSCAETPMTGAKNAQKEVKVECQR